MLSKRFMPLAATASLLTGLGIAAPSVRAATFIQFNSPPGDYIGAGVTQTLTPIDGYITASGSGNRVSINFDGDTLWNLDFAAREGETLVSGSYKDATRFPFNSSTEPGLSVSGDGRGCNTLTGQFDVLQLAYGADGEVERFDADFEQSCEGVMPPLIGQVRFNKADSKASAEEIKQNTQIDPIDLQKLLAFSDKIQELPTALYFFSEPGDYIGQGLEQIFTPEDVDFSGSGSNAGVNFYIDNFSRSERQRLIFWLLALVPPKDLPLIPGTYGRATNFPFNSPTKPGISFQGDGRGCSETGQFVVLDAAYGSNNDIERFDAIFEQHGGLKTAPALYGRIRYNALVEPPPVKSVPEPTMMLGLLGISGLMLSQRRRSKPIKQASERLI